MRLRDCTRVDDSGLPRVDATDFEPLWIAGYYDGPLSGAVLHKGQLCWYLLAEEEREPFAEGWYRRYRLIELTPAQRDEVQRWHDLFRAQVGTHWDYPRLSPGVRVLTDNEVIGWLQL
jgi:hypothetical protein